MKQTKNKSAARDRKQGGESRPVNWTIVYWVSLVLVAVPVYSRLITGFFLNIDDDLFFTNNPHIRSLSFENISVIFTSIYGGNYHPITTLLEAFEHALFGLKPAGFHSVSLVLHLLNTLLVFRLAGRFSMRFEFKALVTFLFAFHPMHVESVAWITDQTDLFCTAFMLLSLDRYVLWLHSERRSQLLYSFLFFILALGSKPAAIALPFLLPVVDFHFGKRISDKWSAKLLFLLPALIFAYVTYVALDASASIDKELLPSYSFAQRLVVANFALAYYVVSFLFPYGLSALHLAPAELPFHYYLAIPFNLALVYGIWRIRERSKALITGSLLFLLPIGLVLQLIPSGYNVVAERYTYFPYIGLSMMWAWLIAGDTDGSLVFPKILRGRMRSVGLVLCAVFLILTFNRTGDWKDLLTINRNIADRNPTSGFAQLSAVSYELDAGEADAALQRLAECESLDTASAQVWFMKGKAYRRVQQPAKAVDAFRRSREIQPIRKDLDEFLAIGYFENGQMDSAAAYFTVLINADSLPNATYLSNRAICRYYLKDYEEAISDFTAAIKADPSLGNLLGQRGICYAEMGDAERGCKDLRAAVSAGYTDFQKELDNYCAD